MSAKELRRTKKHTEDSRRFQSFDETFKYCTYGLAFALIYPNRVTIKKRLGIFVFFMFANSIQLYWFGTALVTSLIRLDMVNLTRHLTVGILIILFIFKTIYCIYNTEKFENILNTISDDMIEFNNEKEAFKDTCEEYIKKARIGQLVWVVLPIFLALQYPVYAGICLIYDNLTMDYPGRYMVHEMDIAHLTAVQDISPYFEFIFIMSLLTVMCLVPNFIGFEGFFCISTTHLCLKLKYVSYIISKAFEGAEDSLELNNKIKQGIQIHQKALKYYEDLQNFFEPWLFLIFVMTSTCVSFNLYQVYILTSPDPKHIIFGITTICHTYINCVYASNLTQCGEDLALDLYNVSWEKRFDIRGMKLLIFMIARAQRPLELGGYGIVVYNMQLFIAIMKTSYSFYTLITN
ncbi:odorant receptor Or2-like [Achroia grisella]|uniref:odorant receptor Or2-like n=1 Tax=Achroia grisella TaxID=688607 RepID=UPI0027D2944A|nr:odorant receptor Or2-like [Achroia grisella]